MNLDLSNYGGGAPKRCKKGTNKMCLTPSQTKLFKEVMIPPSTTRSRVAKGRVKNGMQFLRPSSYNNRALPALPYYYKPLPPIPRYNKPLPPIPRPLPLPGYAIPYGQQGKPLPAIPVPYNKPLPSIPTLSQRVSSKVDAYRRLRPGTRVMPFGLNDPQLYQGLTSPASKFTHPFERTYPADINAPSRINPYGRTIGSIRTYQDIVMMWRLFVTEALDGMNKNLDPFSEQQFTIDDLYRDRDLFDRVILAFHQKYPNVEIVQTGRTVKAAINEFAEKHNLNEKDAKDLAKDEFDALGELQQIFARDNPGQLLII